MIGTCEAYLQKIFVVSKKSFMINRVEHVDMFGNDKADGRASVMSGLRWGPPDRVIEFPALNSQSGSKRALHGFHGGYLIGRVLDFEQYWLCAVAVAVFGAHGAS